MLAIAECLIELIAQHRTHIALLCLGDVALGNKLTMSAFVATKGKLNNTLRCNEILHNYSKD